MNILDKATAVLIFIAFCLVTASFIELGYTTPTVTIKSIWSEIKEAQTLVAAIFAFLAARYAYLHTKRRDFAKAKIIEKIITGRVHHALGQIEALRVFINLAIKHSLEKESPIQSILTVANGIAEGIKESIDFDMINDLDTILHLEPNQYDKICLLAMYVEECVKDILRMTDLEANFQKVMLEDLQKKILEYEKGIREILNRKQ